MVAHPTSLADLARRCKSGGLRALSRSERQEFRALFEKEIRKCAFKPRCSNAHEVLTQFCDHVVRGFNATAQPRVVTDSRPYLRRTARRLAKHRVPTASLILYAAWIEHWVNIMVTVAMLRSGKAPIEPLRYLKTQPKFDDKLKKLACVVGLTALPKKIRDSLIQVVKTRNEHLHFTWEGKSPERSCKDENTVRVIVKRCETILDDALAFEHQQFDAPHAQIVSSVFRLR